VRIGKARSWLIPTATVRWTERSSAALKTIHEAMAKEFRGAEDAWHLSRHLTELTHHQKPAVHQTRWNHVLQVWGHWKDPWKRIGPKKALVWKRQTASAISSAERLRTNVWSLPTSPYTLPCVMPGSWTDSSRTTMFPGAGWWCYHAFSPEQLTTRRSRNWQAWDMSITVHRTIR